MLFILFVFPNIAFFFRVIAAPVLESAPSKDAAEDDDAPEEGGPKILSKKEKEKLKKEREKVRFVFSDIPL